MTVCLSVSIFVQPLCATVIVYAVPVTQNSHVAFNQFSLAGYPNFTLLLLTAPLPLSPEYPTSTGPKCFDECVSKWDFEREAPSAARDVKQLSFVKSGWGPRGFASLRVQTETLTRKSCSVFPGVPLKRHVTHAILNMTPTLSGSIIVTCAHAHVQCAAPESACK